MGRKWLTVVVACTAAAWGVAAAALPAQAAGRPTTLTVGTDHATCPAAEFHTIQAAINDAHSGDTVLVCAGTYVEGSGLRGSNAMTITKDLTLKGAGAGQVTIEPRRRQASGGQIAPTNPDIRSGTGDILAVVGDVQDP